MVAEVDAAAGARVDPEHDPHRPAVLQRVSFYFPFSARGARCACRLRKCMVADGAWLRVCRPGMGKANPGNQASVAYNKNICMQTTRWAIVDWLKDEHRDGIWGVSRCSFFLH